MESEEETHTLSSLELLQLAESHLRLRNYSLSSQYALESLQCTASGNGDQDLRLRAQRIVSVSDVLSAASETLGSNSYSVLGVDTFCADINLIRSKFKSLLLLLEPIRSTFPPADEAMRSAWKAWNLLGNSDKKSELDSQLMAGLAGESRDGEESGSFWTFCPYCYFLYEYARVFEGYCLRCQNGSCRRVFQGVSIRIPTSVGSNQGRPFSGFGCFPLGFSHMEGARNGGKFASWSPFVGLFGYPEEKTPAKRKALDADTDFIEISDGSEDSEAPMQYEGEQIECGIQGNGSVQGAGSHVAVNVNGNKLMHRGKVFQMNNCANLSDAISNGGVVGEANFDQGEEEFGFVSEECARAGYEYYPEADDMHFVEKDGEIFLEMPSDDEDL